MGVRRRRNEVLPARARRLDDNDRECLAKIAGDSVLFDEPMSRHTTLRIGGPADAWFSPQSIEELRRILSLCSERGIAVTPIGGGSNLLVRDGGIPGVALSTRKLRGLERVGELGIRVEAGISTGKLLASATSWELGGVEFLGGVPGSVGGGLIMNAGTYLGEFKDVTTHVTSVVLATGDIVTRENRECGFAYRNSALPKTEVVVEAVLQLKHRAKDEIKAEVRALRDRRNDREPKKVSNAGSVFKNPEGDYAGRLIEVAGLKGTTVGGAQCSPVHANWFVNIGGATAANMLELIKIARAKVSEMHGVNLVLEWKLVGEDAR